MKFLPNSYPEIWLLKNWIFFQPPSGKFHFFGNHSYWIIKSKKYHDHEMSSHQLSSQNQESTQSVWITEPNEHCGLNNLLNLAVNHVLISIFLVFHENADLYLTHFWGKVRISDLFRKIWPHYHHCCLLCPVKIFRN